MVPPGNPPVTTADFEVPIAGFSANGQMYVFYSTDRLPRDDDEPMRRTVLARARGTDPTDLEWLYDASDRRVVGRFINICLTVLDGGLAGLPFAGPALLMRGSGHYRKSHLYLACVPLDLVENRAAWQFCVGREAGSGQPLWSDQEADAAPLLVHPQIGEFSVSWLAPLDSGFCSTTAATRLVASSFGSQHTHGAGSHPQLAFGPSWPGLGYGHFMHVSWDAGGTDDLWDPGRGHEWGGEYGPYTIGRFTRGLGHGKALVYFVMTTWNPYNTVLMISTFASAPGQPAIQGAHHFAQSPFGAQQRNFELVAPGGSCGGLVHVSRNGDRWPPPWGNPYRAGTESRACRRDSAGRR